LSDALLFWLVVVGLWLKKFAHSRCYFCAIKFDRFQRHLVWHMPAGILHGETCRSHTLQCISNARCHSIWGADHECTVGCVSFIAVPSHRAKAAFMGYPVHYLAVVWPKFCPGLLIAGCKITRGVYRHRLWVVAVFL